MSELVTKGDFEEKVIKSKKPVLVDFFAAWCGPCQMMSPIIDELAKETEDKAEVYKVDVDRESDLANKFQVMSIPTIVIFKDGKIISQHTGVTKKEELIKALLANQSKAS